MIPQLFRIGNIPYWEQAWDLGLTGLPDCLHNADKEALCQSQIYASEA